MAQPWNMWNPAGMHPGMTTPGYFPTTHPPPGMTERYSPYAQPTDKQKSKSKNPKPEIPGLPPPPTPPKKPVTSFFAYFMKIRETLKKQHPDKPVTTLSLIASKMWKAATPEERKVTEMEYLDNMEKYKVARAEYEASEEYKSWLALKQKLEREVHERALTQAKEATQSRPSPPQRSTPPIPQSQVTLPQPPMAHQHPPPQAQPMIQRHTVMQQPQMMPNFYSYYQMPPHGWQPPASNIQPAPSAQSQQQTHMNDLVGCVGDQRGAAQMQADRQMERKQLGFEVADVMGERSYKVSNLGWRMEPLMPGGNNTNNSPNNSMPTSQGPHG